MAQIYAPNKEYTGVSAGVSFCNGVGEAEDPHIIEWFISHGYQVEDQVDEIPPEQTVVEEDKDTEQVSVSVLKKKPAKKASE